MSQSHTVCFVDFDHTLFNTDEFFHVEVRNHFLRFGIDLEYWEKSYAAIWHTGYTLEKHAEELWRESGKELPLAQMKAVLQESFSDLKKYLFPDVGTFLEEARAKGISIYLLSFGDPGWQRYKVLGSGIQDYFKETFFTTEDGGKAKTVLRHAQGFDRAVVIDNNSTELDLIADSMPEAETYCMNRVPNELVRPPDELSRLKFLEARRYLEKKWRHHHVACKILKGIL